MTKPITKIASDATHGGKDVGSPTPFVNKFDAKSSQVIHKSWPKLQEGVEDGAEYAKVLASEHQDFTVEANEECEEGYIKDEKGQCVESGDDLTETEINTDGGTISSGNGVDLSVANQSGGDG